jgi:hypothetical protein
VSSEKAGLLTLWGDFIKRLVRRLPTRSNRMLLKQIIAAWIFGMSADSIGSKGR